MVTDHTRRTLLKAALFGAAYPLAGCVATSGQVAKPTLIGCAISGRDRFNAIVADQYGMPLRRIPLPERGHGVASNAALNHAVAFARRPGSYFQVFDFYTGKVIKLKLADKKRHYYGHGVYSNDGRFLYATEGEQGSSRGIIGVYEVALGYLKVAEFSGFGLGPHEIIIMPDDTLAIGVGGVHTDGRVPQNLATMTPSLSYLSPSGDLLEQVRLADHQLSIRHLAHDGAKTVLCGQQYRGEPDAFVPLLAMHQQGSALIPLQAEPEQWARFNHYIASIAATEDWILATSPRGNCYGIWSKQSQKLVELASLADASGVVAQGDTFKVSSGAGSVVSQTEPNEKRILRSGIQWDNHWSVING